MGYPTGRGNDFCGVRVGMLLLPPGVPPMGVGGGGSGWQRGKGGDQVVHKKRPVKTCRIAHWRGFCRGKSPNYRRLMLLSVRREFIAWLFQWGLS